MYGSEFNKYDVVRFLVVMKGLFSIVLDYRVVCSWMHRGLKVGPRVSRIKC